ncbi:iron uptake porin [Microcoleus sp. T3_B1]
MHIHHFPPLIIAFILGTPAVFLLTSSPTFAVPIDRLVAHEPLNTLTEKPFAQVNSVSQLSDVKPTDWAFQALQSLVERYGCIVGYPDGTYRGNRALTRYEFAAGLNSCLDRVSELIAAGTTNQITGEDLAIVQKLQEEFATELSVLRGRVDALDARTAELEANQFSTTTKLNAEIIVVVTDTPLPPGRWRCCCQLDDRQKPHPDCGLCRRKSQSLAAK